MTKSDQKSIVQRVDWIHKNRNTIKGYESEIRKIETDLYRVHNDTIKVLEDLKKDMGDLGTVNIKIGDKYYTLTQNAAGVNIETLLMHIES